MYYDGVDQDCDGMSDYDQDGDGYDDVAYGGDDCDDTDSTTYGDDDGDGYLDCVDDCDDGDAKAPNPGGTEICGDGIDQDCDGSDLPCYTQLSLNTINGMVMSTLLLMITQCKTLELVVKVVRGFALPTGWEVALRCGWY